MKKIFWITALILGIGTTIFGAISLDTSAKEADMYLEVLLDDVEAPYASSFGQHSMRRFNPPMLFRGLADSLQETIEAEALLLGVDVEHYVIAKTLSTYDSNYVFDDIILQLNTLVDDALESYVVELKDVLFSYSDDIKETLDTVRQTYQEEIKTVKETYKDDLRTLFRSLRNASETEKVDILASIEAIKEDILIAIESIQSSFLLDLEANKIAVEGLYFIFVQRMESMEERVDRFEHRFPRLYDHVKSHFNR
jgi:hypothetical protein